MTKLTSDMQGFVRGESELPNGICYIAHVAGSGSIILFSKSTAWVYVVSATAHTTTELL